MDGLQELMASIRDMTGEQPAASTDPVDLLLYAPCPVKLAVKDRIEALAASLQGTPQAFTWHIPMGCTSIDPYDPVYKETDPARLPAVIASIGFGDFWRKPFVERFVETGVFEAVRPETINPMHVRAGMLDPAGAYTIYGATPYIFVVDTRRLGALPVPRAWADLMHPRYKGHLVMCGDGDDMADAVLLNLFKDYALEGLRDFASNVKGLMHSSRMAKIAGSNEADAGSIYVIPAFFAYSVKQPPHVELVWPEDGAAASPLYLLARKDCLTRMRPVLDFFANGFGAIDSAAWFAPLGLPRASQLPAGATLKWVGWDFVARHDVNALRDQLGDAFRRMARGLPGGLA